MKRLFMLAVVSLPLLFTSCKKDEDFWEGVWTYEEVSSGVTWSVSFYVHEGGTCTLYDTKSDIYDSETYTFSGRWVLNSLDNEVINVRVQDNDEYKWHNWTFRKRGTRKIWWIDEELELIR